MPRPGKGSLPSSPSAYPWIRVEYSSDTIDLNEDELHENDVSFQKEIQLNEMKKRMIRATSAYQVIAFPVIHLVYKYNIEIQIACYFLSQTQRKLVSKKDSNQK